MKTQDLPPENEGWISFKEKPKHDQVVLVWMYGREMVMGWKDGPVLDFMKAWKPYERT